MPGLESSLAMAVNIAPFPAAYFISHILVGAIYLGQCPIQPFIPIYLLGLGFSLLMLILPVYIYYRLRVICSNTDSPPSALERLTPDSALTASILIVVALDAIFVLCWSITGNVWICPIYEPNYTNSTSDQYCEKTVYLWAFWNTVGFDLLLGLLLLGGCCFFAFSFLARMNSGYETV